MKNTQDQQREVSRRINPDSLGTLWLALSFVIVLAVVSFMVSFAGLSEVAKWVGLPPMLSWTVPTFIDTAIIAYGLAALIHRHRGEPAAWSMVSLLAFTLVSVIANGAHALSVDHAETWQAWIGAGIAGLAPLAVFASTEELGRLVIERPAHRTRVRTQPAVVESPEGDGPRGGGAPLPETTTEAPAAETALPETVEPEPVEETMVPESPVPAEPSPVVSEPVVEEVPAPVEEPVTVHAPDATPDLVQESTVADESSTPLFDALASSTAPVTPVVAPEPVAATSLMPTFDLRPRITPVQRTVAEVRAEAGLPVTDPVNVTETAEPAQERPTLIEDETPVQPAPAAGGGQVTEMDRVARYVASQINAGTTPKASELAEILGCVERTARRKLAKVREDRPELFETAANTAKKEA